MKPRQCARDKVRRYDELTENLRASLAVDWSLEQARALGESWA